MGQVPGDTDCLPIRNSAVVWVDHCKVYNASRGTVDVVYGSLMVTISNCYIHNKQLTMLLGAADTFVEDVHMNVTTYRNWFANSGQRQPHCRWGHCHVANNLYTNWGFYCIGGRVYANVRTDNNIFVAGYTKEVTPFFSYGLYTPGFDYTPTITSFNDLLLNGSTFWQWPGSKQPFSPPYYIPLAPADYVLLNFLQSNVGPHW